MQKSVYEVETKVDEMVGKFIKRRKTYDIDFQIGVIMSQEYIK